MSASVIRALIVLAVLIFFIILANKSRKKDVKTDLDKISLYNAIKSKVIDAMSDKSRFEFAPPTYDMFKEYYIQNLYNEILENIDTNGCEYLKCQKMDINKEKAIKYLYEQLHSDFVDSMLTRYYSEYEAKIVGNIKDAEELESEAIKYHESFGKEASGDPILHPKEPNNEESTMESETYRSIEDLISTGTVEDIDE